MFSKNGIQDIYSYIYHHALYLTHTLTLAHSLPLMASGCEGVNCERRDYGYMCHLCSETRKSIQMLLAHFKLHQDEIPKPVYQCFNCPRPFRTKWDREDHMSHGTCLK